MTAIASVLLDTTVVVDHLRGKSPSIAQQFKLVGTLYLPLTAWASYSMELTIRRLQPKVSSKSLIFSGFAPSLPRMSAPHISTAGSRLTYREREN